MGHKTPERYLKMTDIESPMKNPPDIFSMGSNSNNLSPDMKFEAESNEIITFLQPPNVSKR